MSIPKMLNLFLITLLSDTVLGARTLGVFPIPAKSHQIVYDSLMVELANHGHEVVTITNHPIDKPPKKLTQIDVSQAIVAWNSASKYAQFADKKPIDFLKNYKARFTAVFEAELKTPALENMMKDQNEHFDLIIISIIVNQAFGFAHRLKGVPYIGIASLTTDYDTVGAPDHPLLYHNIEANNKYDLTITDKFGNIYDYLNMRYIHWYYTDAYDLAMRKYFGKEMPSLNTLKSNVDMLFVSGNPLLLGIRPEVPAIVNIAGIHLKPKNPLPKDLQQYLDESPHGVVYMSFGSNVRSVDLGNEIIQLFKDAFAELPFNFIWKYESDYLPGLPENVRIQKWLPQQGMLGHKNIKAFIFQGGLQSLEEAVRGKTPMICFPFAVDQHVNAAVVERKRLGFKFDIKTLTKEHFKDAIKEIVTKSEYKENVQKLSDLMTDQPMTPMEKAVWWTEYVLRHKGAKHLRAPAADASLEEYFMLDVLTVLCFLLIAATVFVIVIVKFFIMSNIDNKIRMLAYSH